MLLHGELGSRKRRIPVEGPGRWRWGQGGVPFVRRQFNASLAAGVFQIQCKPRRRPPRDMQHSRRPEFAACGRAEPATGRSSPRARSPCSMGASDASQDAHTKRRALLPGERGVRPRGGKSLAGRGASNARVHLVGDAAVGKHGRDPGPCVGRASLPPRRAAAAKAVENNVNEELPAKKRSGSRTP